MATVRNAMTPGASSRRRRSDLAVSRSYVPTAMKALRPPRTSTPCPVTFGALRLPLFQPIPYLGQLARRSARADISLACAAPFIHVGLCAAVMILPFRPTGELRRAPCPRAKLSRGRLLACRRDDGPET